METENQALKEQKPSITALIQTEWETIKNLQKMMASQELSVKEKTAVANVLAFHINTLNKLLTQGGKQEDLSEQTLGDYIRTVEPRIARHFRRDYRQWKRTLSLKRSR